MPFRSVTAGHKLHRRSSAAAARKNSRSSLTRRTWLCSENYRRQLSVGDAARNILCHSLRRYRIYEKSTMHVFCSACRGTCFAALKYAALISIADCFDHAVARIIQQRDVVLPLEKGLIVDPTAKAQSAFHCEHCPSRPHVPLSTRSGPISSAGCSLHH